MPLTDLTAVGRTLAPRYRSDPAIASLAGHTTVGAGAWQWLARAAFLDGALWGIGAGLAVFLSWALVTSLLMTSLAGREGMVVLLPLWAAMLGTALQQLVARGYLALGSGRYGTQERERGGMG